MYIRLEKGIFMVGGGSGGPGISNFKDCNVYLVEGERDAFLIDGGSGMDTGRIIENIRETGCPIDKITHMFVTHAHGDHGGGIEDYRGYIPGMKVLASAGEARLLENGTEEELGLTAAKCKGAYPQDYVYKHCQVDHRVEDGEMFQAGDAVVRAVTLSGHSVESVCYVVDKGGKRYLFSGDSIYLNGVLSLINCYGSTMEGYRQNIGKLAGLNVEALIPSHFRLTLSGGQAHIDKAIEALRCSSLPPMM